MIPYGCLIKVIFLKTNQCTIVGILLIKESFPATYHPFIEQDGVNKILLHSNILESFERALLREEKVGPCVGFILSLARNPMLTVQNHLNSFAHRKSE